MSLGYEKEQDIVTKAKLTEKEQDYLNQRNDLRLARENYQANFVEEDQEEQGETVEEYADSLTPEQVEQALKDRDIKYSKNASHATLVNLLVADLHKN